MNQPHISLKPDTQLLDEIIERLRRARAVQVVGHVHPDGDCIGSLLAMHHLLDWMNKPHALAAQKLGRVGGYDAMEGFALIRPEPDAALNADVTVYVDTASLERGLEGWRPSTPIINIDHHEGNTRFGEINWIEPQAAAVGEMLYHLASHADAPLTPPLAEALLVAITTDTGSFRFGNTGSDQHRLAAELIDAGASPTRVARLAFDSQSVEGLRLVGSVLERLRIESDGRLAWSELRAPDYAAVGGPENAPENLVGMLRSPRGVGVAILFHELPEGGMRVNFRSDGTLDVRRLAERWGGGGHPAAAGLSLPDADYERQRDEIVRAALSELEDR